jgi:hypothetical protein
MFLQEEEELNKAFVLKRITEEQIFCYYFPLDAINYKRFYKNPLREDNDAGCKFYIHKTSGILYFKDFAWRSFDAFSFVQVKYFLNFNEAIFKIIQDFKLCDVSFNLTKEVITKLKKPAVTPKKVFSFDIKSWNTPLIEYWRKYISWITVEDLTRYNIFPLYKYYVDKECKYTNYKDIAFLYRLDKHIFQLYAPNKLFESIKFLTTSNKIFGIKSVDYNKEYIVIAKSYKDFFLMRLLNINCIGVLSETIRLDADAINCIEKFKFQFTLFDNDTAGKKASITYKKDYNTIPLLFPKGEPKDFSDNLLKYGERDVNDMILDFVSSQGFFL